MAAASPPSSPQRPLHVAAKTGRLPEVERLVSEGPSSVLERDEEGKTALLVAAGEGQVIVVEWLVTGANADIKAKANDGKNAVILAASGGHQETVERLVTMGADLSATDDNGTTALMAGAIKGSVEVVMCLLTNCSDVINLQDKDGYTALSHAAKRGHRDVVDVLTNVGGADPWLKTKAGQTAEQMAPRGDIRELLLRAQSRQPQSSSKTSSGSGSSSSLSITAPHATAPTLAPLTHSPSFKIGGIQLPSVSSSFIRASTQTPTESSSLAAPIITSTGDGTIEVTVTLPEHEGSLTYVLRASPVDSSSGLKEAIATFLGTGSHKTLISGLRNWQKYTVAVSCVEPSGKPGAFSPESAPAMPGVSPAYPAIVEVVSVEETSVCLRLHAPPENDASLLIGYVLKLQPGSREIEVPVLRSANQGRDPCPITVEDLQPGTSYAVVAAARNQKGLGPFPSDPTLSTTFVTEGLGGNPRASAPVTPSPSSGPGHHRRMSQLTALLVKQMEFKEAKAFAYRQALDEMGIDCPTHLVNGYKHGWITHNFLMEESKGRIPASAAHIMVDWLCEHSSAPGSNGPSVSSFPSILTQGADGGVSKAMKMAGLASQASGSIRSMPADISGAQNSQPASPSGPWGDSSMRLERSGTSHGDGSKRSTSGSGWWSAGRAA